MNDISNDSKKEFIFEAMKHELSNTKLYVESKVLISQGRIPECLNNILRVRQFLLKSVQVLFLFIVFLVIVESSETKWRGAITITAIVGLLGWITHSAQRKLTRMQVLLELWDNHLFKTENIRED